MPRIGIAMVLFLAAASTVQAQFEDDPFLPLQVLAETVDPETGNRYQLTSVTSYLAAHAFAEEQGGWLWSVNSAREMNLVIDSFLAARETAIQTFETPPGFAAGPPDGDLYIGLTDSDIFGFNEGNFQWINGDPVTFTNWSGGEPNNVGVGLDPAGEDYAEIWSLTGDRSWNDDNDRGSGLNGLPPIMNPDGTPNARLPAGGNLAVIEFPPVPPPAIVEINPETGFARITSQEPEATFELRSYEISSNTPLDFASWNASNLTTRQENPSPMPGQKWEVVNSAEDQVFETFLFGGVDLAPGESVVIGRVFEPAVAAEDLELSINFATSNWLTGATDSVASFGAPFSFADFEVDIEIPDVMTGDCSGDGVIDITDANCTAIADLDNFLASIESLRGDLDGDGTIQFSDFLILSQSFGQAGSYTNGDLDLDGSVLFSDFLLFSANFGNSAAAVASVPEPESMHLLGITLVLLVGLRSRRRSQRRRIG